MSGCCYLEGMCKKHKASADIVRACYSERTKYPQKGR